MHEMSLAMNVMERVDRCLADFGPGARVARITLEVGRLRAVVPEALRFCFQVVSQETPAEDAQLIIEEIPVRVRCEPCDREWDLERVDFRCPDCRGPVATLTGRELLLRGIEVEE
jgi:hydrogenase nickel incorporation protein HypA/HybF